MSDGASATTVYNAPVMRSPALFRLMLRLSLVAVLLMSVAPAVSRVLAAGDAARAPILMELCTSAGLKLIDVSSFIGADEPATPAHSAVDAACGYCLLATPLPLLLLLVLALVFGLAAGPLFRPYTAVMPRPRNPRGLGSQGPPLVL